MSTYELQRENGEVIDTFPTMAGAVCQGLLIESENPRIVRIDDLADGSFQVQTVWPMMEEGIEP